MKHWFRLLYVLISWRSRPGVGIDQVSRLSLRVWPTDLDLYNHVNNGVYLSLMDLGRFDQGLRTGFWQVWNRRGWFPVVVSSTISYRKALLPWQKFTIETKVLGWDDVAFFVEQRFVREDEIYARSILRIRFLKRSKGILAPQEVLEGSGGWPVLQPEPALWIRQWGKDSQLPKAKESAPSVWD